MEEMTIGQARDNFSALIANLLSGAVSEYVVKNRDTPVVRIVPVRPRAAAPARPFGIAQGNPFLLDDDAFDALDAEIADEFGV